MEQSSVGSGIKPANEMAAYFGAPALVGPEKLEDYENLGNSIAAAINPIDAIGWMFTRDVTDWSWDIQRERTIKVEVIKYFKKEVVAELLRSTLAPSGQLENALYRIFQAGAEISRWSTDPEARMLIDKALAEKGYDANYILAQAYMRAAGQIEAIDKRITAYEQRRTAALRGAGLWTEGLQKRLTLALPPIIDGEFNEASE